MIKIGVISNPRSARNRRGFGRIRRVLARHADALHAELGAVSDLGAVLRDFARREVGLVVVNGGDGTVQATLTEILARRPYDPPPLLAVLPRGMSNMIAGDVGLRAPAARALDRLIARAREDGLESAVAARHVMRMDPGGEDDVRYGMFFGTAVIFRAIETSRNVFQRRGVRDPAAAAFTLATILIDRVAGGRRGKRFYRGEPMAVEIDGGPRAEAAYFLLMVTTLERLILHMRPFRGEGDGALHYTSVAFPPPRFLRLVLPLLYGRRPDDLPPEYVSRNVNRVALTLDCPFTLDGELFRPRFGTPVTLSRAGPVRFVRG